MKQNFLTIVRLWKLLSGFHKRFYIQLASTITQQLLQVAVVVLTAKMLDAVITKNVHTLPILIGIYFSINVISNRIGYYTEVHTLRYIKNAVQQFLEEYSFKKIFSLNAFQYTESHSAIKLQVINRGENAIEQIISNIVLMILPAISQVVFSILAIAFYSTTLALWCAVTLILTVIWSNKFATYHRPFIKQNIEYWDNQKKIRSEAFQHLMLIKLIAAESFYLKKYLANRLRITEYDTMTWTKGLHHGYARGLVLNTSRVVSTIILFILAIKNLITIGAVYAIWSWINDAYIMIRALVQNIRQLPLRFSEVEKYLEIIDMQPEFNEHGIKTVDVTRDITFSNVSFSYPQGVTPVFKNLSFTIPAHKTTAFVGSSGSGKSTIVKLLMRVYDYTSGTIHIGNTSIHNIDAQYLRERIGYVEQHVDLFDDTLEANILLGARGKGIQEAKQDLEHVAKKTRIDQFYHRLGKAKFKTVLGERGVKLSGGERQRVGIARAIIKNPDILIFDEATSALDSENEKYVMEAINEVSKGKTTIIIAHRLSTVVNADKIIVMDKGNIIAEGTHSELMQNSLQYKALIEHQMIDM
jgi:ABC-type multidrug transport system fused ATPase/permease subunit